ncbi:4-alpha-glucanotransferase [Synechococcus sp. CCY9201]|uniref:4-alpha-glucanotransferase n=1 Tax=Synechococcus sp. CCY9201 TaxID=174697 RepID=UPI002B1F8D00|nr:4-alpha-glucanotransferase [Synechococcus sp. CCY9201]MEA5475734.1 4-alpha-glucanotransferase [Synechococcus sp. CCY9201]
MSDRLCGVLLHPTALPGTPVCGTFGSHAHALIDLLADQGIAAWQLLPLAPTDGTGSPYSSPSGSALNPWLLDADDLVTQGFLEPGDLEALPSDGSEPMAESSAGAPGPAPLDLSLAPARAAALGRLLVQRWASQPLDQKQRFGRWRRQQRSWLRDHCRFMVLRRLQEGQPWWNWPGPLARRHSRALRTLDQQHGPALLEEGLLQWHLQRQWDGLQRHAHRRGVQLIGDLPFYVAHDSADVWRHRSLFSLQFDGSLAQQSGVPPDYFSATGQLWGTPVYRWSAHWLGGFRWWLRRLGRQLQLFDRLRLDHFRALQAYWSIPGSDTTAQNGTWQPSPGWPLLALLWLDCWRRGGLLPDGRLPLIAEDLGVITPAVEALRDSFALPGMKILQFAFDGNADNPYLPANYRGNRWVVYTGTHDNATSRSWWDGLDQGGRDRVRAVVGADVTAPGWQLLEAALATEAELVVVPLQDLLELDDRARFNTPGTTGGNWCWRLNRSISDLKGPLLGFGRLADRYGRSSPVGPGGAG